MVPALRGPGTRGGVAQPGRRSLPPVCKANTVEQTAAAGDAISALVDPIRTGRKLAAKPSRRRITSECPVLSCTHRHTHGQADPIEA